MYFCACKCRYLAFNAEHQTYIGRPSRVGQPQLRCHLATYTCHFCLAIFDVFFDHKRSDGTNLDQLSKKEAEDITLLVSRFRQSLQFVK